MRTRTRGYAALAALILLLACTPDETPVRITGPDSGRAGDTLRFAACAGRIGDPPTSLRLDWGDGDTSEWSPLVAGGDTAGFEHSFAAPGSYAIRVQNRHQPDRRSGWSQALLVGIGQANRAPLTPEAPTGRTDGEIGVEYGFSAGSTDPDNDNISLRFDWGNGEISEWSSFVRSGRGATIAHAFSSVGRHYIRAEARDVRNAASAWSEALMFSVGPPRTHPGLEIRNYCFRCEPYPVGGLYGVSFWGDVFDTTGRVLDSIVIHAKLDVEDTMAWLIADSLLPGTAAGFSFSRLFQGPRSMQVLWATHR